MAITLLRCDDRLIHGQCIVGVLKDCKITDIILIDDFTASNPILSKIYKTAVPGTVKLRTCTVKSSLAEIDAAAGDGSSTLVLVKDPVAVLDLVKSGAQLPKSFNIGPMSSRPEGKKVAFFAYLLPKEIAAVRELVGMGMEVYFQQVPSDNKLPWSASMGT